MDLNSAVQNFVFNKTEFNTATFLFENAPFTSVPFVIATVVGYLALLVVLSAFMKNAAPLKLTGIFYVHNALLCIASLVMLCLIAPIAISDWLDHGLFHAICSLEMSTNNHLNWLYYLNYLTKVYHHSATFVLTWTQLMGRTSVQWVPITFNLFVHVIMYYYYAEASRGKRFWWKKHLTTLQIIQFIVDLGFIYVSMYYALQTPKACQVESWAGYLGTALISSYLVLFIQFFKKTYAKTKSASSRKVHAKEE
ncbi:hypothetical protein HDU91_002472 [Kappamyces sp. JEL0680]|nr:hypothetical protein HDU91_002472 [Kappamyces sp. JEL0680]